MPGCRDACGLATLELRTGRQCNRQPASFEKLRNVHPFLDRMNLILPSAECYSRNAVLDHPVGVESAVGHFRFGLAADRLHGVDRALNGGGTLLESERVIVGTRGETHLPGPAFVILDLA